MLEEMNPLIWLQAHGPSAKADKVTCAHEQHM